MDELIVRCLLGEGSEFEQHKVDAWRRESPANEERYQQFVHVWSLDIPQVPFEFVPPAASEVAVRAEKRRRRHSSRGWGRSVLLRHAIAGAAALFVVAAGIVVASSFFSGPTGLEPRQLATGAGETVTIALDDGSIVRLGPNSRLEVGRSSMRLQGRAYFAVARDQTRPFTVRTASGEARVLGTRFELRASDEYLRLLVVEGRVVLATRDSTVEVVAGQMSHVRGLSPPDLVAVADVPAALDWPGLLVFQATPLQDALNEISRHFGRPPAIVEAAIASRSVTAWFTDETFGEATAAVCRVADVVCTSTAAGAISASR